MIDGSTVMTRMLPIVLLPEQCGLDYFFARFRLTSLYVYLPV